MATLPVSSPVTGIRLFRGIPPHLVVTFSGWAGRLLNTAVQILSVRLLLAGLGSDHYAVYALLTSLLGWYLLADIGIGYSIQNYVSECRATGRNFRDYLAPALLSFGILIVTVLLVVCLLSSFLGPFLLRKYTFLSRQEMQQDFLAVGLFFTVTGVSSLGAKVWYAFQRGFLPNLLTMGASVLTLLGLLWAIHTPISGRFLWCLLAAVGPPAAAALASVVWLVAVYWPGCRVNWTLMRDLWKRAVNFWFISLLGIAVLQIDYLIIAQVLSSHDLVIYSLVARLFAAAYTLYVTAIQALWPVIAELVVQQEWDKVLQHVRQCLFTGLAFMGAVTIFFIAAERPILAVLSPKEHITIPIWLIVLYGVYQLVGVWTGAYAMVLQSKNDLQPFIIWGAVQAVICAPLQWLLAVHFGLEGILFGLLGSYLLTSAWALPVRVRQHIADFQATRADPRK